jgi:hypothetical protein
MRDILLASYKRGLDPNPKLGRKLLAQIEALSDGPYKIDPEIMIHIDAALSDDEVCVVEVNE